jgi:hypothetical protein
MVLPVGWERLRSPLGPEVEVYGGFNKTVIISQEIQRDNQRWLHVSVSRQDRIPDYEELQEIKRVFVGPDKLALQVFPPAEEHVNIHPRCLHLWSCLDSRPVPDFRPAPGLL